LAQYSQVTQHAIEAGFWQGDDTLPSVMRGVDTQKAEYDVQRVGLDMSNGDVVLSLDKRVSSGFSRAWFAWFALFLVLTAIGVGLAYQIGVDDGRHAVIENTNIQLPTLENPE
jgi:hypothetical protein